MSTIFMDGFDHYGTGTASSNTLLAGPYSVLGNANQCVTPPWGPARTGQYCLGFLGGSVFAAPTRRVLPTPGTHFFMSFGFALDVLPSNTNNHIVRFMDGSANILFSLGYTPTGALALYNPGGTQVAITAGPVIVTQNWHFIELEVNTSTHQLIVRVDDAQAANTPVFNVTDATNITGTIAILGLLAIATANGGVYMDDLFVRDSTGSVNNGWLGDRRVATLFPNSDTPISGWTPSYYKEFGAGVLQLAYMQANVTTPVNSNPPAFIAATGASSLDIGSADFTLETWVRFENLPNSGYSTIFCRWDTPSNQRSYRLILGSQAFNGGCLQWDTSTDGTASTVSTPIVYPYTPTLNVWHHIAMVRASGQLLLFVDGQQMGLPINDSSTYFSGGTQVFAIGNDAFGSGVNYLAGLLDETRFTNGYARYTGPFAVPTAAFPRGSGLDSHWSQVAVLLGYDSAPVNNNLIDESSYNRHFITYNGSNVFFPNDGPLLGKYSTVNEAAPDDNNFISAALLNASDILTMTTQPTNGTTVTVGTKNGSTAAVYTFKTTLASAFDVLIDTTAQNTLINLLNAINAGAGLGTKYGTGTTANFDVFATQLPVGQIKVTANIAGTGGNSIAATSTSTGSWATSTLTGGAGIPGPSTFKLQRPPTNTTLISAMQLNVRALKSDSGTASIQNGFIGPLGTLANGAVRPMTVSASYYSDVLESDPDTSGAISPTTIINGQFQVNRTA